ncbi:hypothetical protein MKQ70_19380 [Chitinophaga sedimenti]|uniref:tetratricopeptide repeat protein n=1 Tax=Chitinophaga sedimenti TaxID=2033606 RepID=UPI002003A9D3|nr:hypothetical protein [Chitinophaga sedimenti]MCK7557050.1 hypothetical protein [Chitinophaga sedimenti]
MPDDPAELFKKAADILHPAMMLHGREEEAVKPKQIRDAIAMLDKAISIAPDNFATHWLKGKAYQVLDESKKAYDAFQQSFHYNQENPDVARELAIECCNLGMGEEAVAAARHALLLDRGNAGLMGNLALCYLINGEVEEALAQITTALQVSPVDEINQRLKTIINEVRSGKRKRPYKYADL